MEAASNLMGAIARAVRDELEARGIEASIDEGVVTMFVDVDHPGVHFILIQPENPESLIIHYNDFTVALVDLADPNCFDKLVEALRRGPRAARCGGA